MEENNTQTIDSQEYRASILEAGQKLAAKLNVEIERGNSDVAFFIALNIALFKDFQDVFVDLVGIGEIPLLGEILGLFCTGFLTLFMFQKGWFLQTRLKVMWWLLGFVIDNLPLFNVLPAATILVFYAWHLVKKRSKKAKKKLAVLEKLTMKEIEELNNNIGLVDRDFTTQGKLTKHSKQLVKEAKSLVKSRTEEEKEEAEIEIKERGNKKWIKAIDGMRAKTPPTNSTPQQTMINQSNQQSLSEEPSPEEPGNVKMERGGRYFDPFDVEEDEEEIAT